MLSDCKRLDSKPCALKLVKGTKVEICNGRPEYERGGRKSIGRPREDFAAGGTNATDRHHLREVHEGQRRAQDLDGHCKVLGKTETCGEVSHAPQEVARRPRGWESSTTTGM